MSERLSRAIAVCRDVAIPIGIFWALLMASAAAVSVGRNPTQHFYWGNIVAVTVLGYTMILCAIFLSHFFFGKR